MKILRSSLEIFLATLDRKTYLRDKTTGAIIKVLDTKLEEVFKKYSEGNIKLQDQKIIITRFVGGETSVQMIRQSDDKVIGVRSLAKAVLEADNFFCPIMIQMLGAEGLAGSTDEILSTTEYSAIDTLNSLGNAEIDLKVNNGEYLLREFSTSAFVGVSGEASVDSPKGAHFFDNTTIMKPELRNELIMSAFQAFPANTAVKFILTGTGTATTNK